MPIYEYRAISSTNCELCRNRFEVRQGINDEPLSRCPKCGAEVRRLFPRSFLYLKGSLGHEEDFGGDVEEETGESMPDEDFSEGESWE
jgi:putative FmdB family regulatory protein